MNCPVCSAQMTQSEGGWVCPNCKHVQKAAVTTSMDAVTNKQPVQTTSAAPPIVKKPKLPDSFKTALLLFGLSSSLLLVLVVKMLSPSDIQSGEMPYPWIFLLAGLIGLVVTVGLFGVISRLGMGFTKTAITLAIGYNALIVFVKFILSPSGMYIANEKDSFSTQAGDPNTVLFYLAAGLLVLGLYALVFKLIYKHFVKDFQRRSGINTAVVKKHKSAFEIISLIIGLIFYGGIAILVPIGVGSGISYLGYVFSSVGLILLVAIVAAIVLAYLSFKNVEEQAIKTGEATVLASFFWVGLSLILLYHIMWVVFLATLVSVWPFRTYTPK